MATVYIPKMKPVPDGASDEDRQRMFDEYKADLARLNPGLFNADGTQKTLWQRLKGLFK